MAENENDENGLDVTENVLDGSGDIPEVEPAVEPAAEPTEGEDTTMESDETVEEVIEEISDSLDKSLELAESLTDEAGDEDPEAEVETKSPAPTSAEEEVTFSSGSITAYAAESEGHYGLFVQVSDTDAFSYRSEEPSIDEINELISDHLSTTVLGVRPIADLRMFAENSLV